MLKEKTRSSLERRLLRSTELRARTSDSKSDLSGRERGVAQVVLEEGVGAGGLYVDFGAWEVVVCLEMSLV